MPNLHWFPEPFFCHYGSVNTTTIKGRTTDLTDVQRTIIDTLYNEGKPQMVIAERAGCSETVSKHIYGRLTGRESVWKKQQG